MKKVIAVLALVLAAGAALFFLNRPPAPFDPAELTPAETANPYPGEVYLLCQTVSSPNSLTLWFLNHTDQTFYHGDPPDRMSLQVLLDDLWYNVPHREYSTAGEGTVTGPGEKFIFAPILSPHGDLPDGQYRIAFGYWEYDPQSDAPISRQPYYQSCAEFRIEDGRYALPAE